MTPNLIQPVIMSGGSGTRLWPMSRQAKPKQFLKLRGSESLFQQTLLRLSGDGFAQPVIIAGEAHRDHIEHQAREIGIALAAIIIEPEARNTAAVAAAAARWAQTNQPDALILLAPADHHIEDPDGFRERIVRASDPAKAGRIVTFGIKPTEPHTGYGYIECAAQIADDAYAVAAFHEKPSRDVAQNYLEKGGFYWNAGIFLFSPEIMIQELKALAPGVFEAVDDAFSASQQTGVTLHLDGPAFSKSPSTSIDYAVMEKTSLAGVIAPVDVGWSDIGAWTALSTPDDEPRIIEINSSNTIVYTDGPVVATIGVSDLVIVATEHGVLVAAKDQAQDVKEVINTLKERRLTDRL